MSSHFFNHHTCMLIVQRNFGLGNIFDTPLEYKFYLKLLVKYKQIYAIKVFAFCLLSSAVYLITGARDAGQIVTALDETNRAFYKFIRVVRNSSREDFKICRSRVVVIGDDKELCDMITFVESFPVKRGLAEREADYEWSSFRLRAFGIDSGLVDYAAGSLF